MTTISIAMATYNGETFLRKQLDSLASQTKRPSELVITDDGSTDNTIAIAKAFANEVAFPVRINSNESRIGFRANFMRCAQLCTGDLIAFSDQDDVWHSTKLERLTSHFEDQRILLVCHRAALIDENDRELGRTVHQIDQPGRYSSRDLLPFAYAHGFTQVFRRELLPLAKYWELSADCTVTSQPMAHDQFFIFLALLLGKIQYDDSILAYYRQHVSNATPHIVAESRLTTLKQKFKDRAQQYKDITFLAQNRLDLIHAMSADQQLLQLFPNAAHNLRDAASRYQSYLQSTERRLQFYDSDSINRQLSTIAAGLMAGDYKLALKNNWGFTIIGAMRDFASLLKLPLR